MTQEHPRKKLLIGSWLLALVSLAGVARADLVLTLSGTAGSNVIQYEASGQVTVTESYAAASSGFGMAPREGEWKTNFDNNLGDILDDFMDANQNDQLLLSNGGISFRKNGSQFVVFNLLDLDGEPGVGDDDIELDAAGTLNYPSLVSGDVISWQGSGSFTLEDGETYDSLFTPGSYSRPLSGGNYTVNIGSVAPPPSPTSGNLVLTLTGSPASNVVEYEATGTVTVTSAYSGQASTVARAPLGSVWTTGFDDSLGDILNDSMNTGFNQNLVLSGGGVSYRKNDVEFGVLDTLDLDGSEEPGEDNIELDPTSSVNYPALVNGDAVSWTGSGTFLLEGGETFGSLFVATGSFSNVIDGGSYVVNVISVPDPIIAHMTVVNSTLLSFPTASGTVYRLEYTPNLIDTNSWSDAGIRVVGDGNTKYLFDPVVSDGVSTQRLYRVVSP